MNKKFNKLWHDPVWSKVISAAIIFILGSAITYFLNLWPAISSFGHYVVAFIYKKAVSKIELSGWVFIILFALSSVTVINWLWALVDKIWSKDESISWTSYLTDEFYGVRWRWTYSNDNGLIIDQDIHPFCLTCDYQVRPIRSSSYSSIHDFVLYCDSCDKSVASFDERYSSLLNKIKRFIQKKIRNNEWKDSQK